MMFFSLYSLFRRNLTGSQSLLNNEFELSLRMITIFLDTKFKEKKYFLVLVSVLYNEIF